MNYSLIISKKQFVFFTVLASLMTIFSSFFSFHETVSAASGGSGSSESPYKISVCADLSDVNDNPDAVYELTNDVSCSGVDPGRIGSQSAPFTGEFRGGGHTISDITVVNTQSNMGLFGYTSEAAIYDLKLDNIYFGGVDNVGALVGHTYYTTISYVSVTNSTITGTGQHTGGIVGYLGGSSITRSFVNDSTIEGVDLVGGLAGIVIGPSTITDSYIQGVIEAQGGVGGITGQVGAGPAYIINTYADTNLGSGGPDIAGTIESGASVSASFMASAPYLSNSTESPLDAWDFDTIWEVRDGDYPGLQSFPQMLCEAPTATVSTIEAACQTEPILPVDAVWEIQYAYADSSDWSSIPDQTGVGFDATVNGLLPGTEYKVRFRFIWEGRTSPWGSQEFLTEGESDVDGDGVSNKEEALSPNDGDANDDGTQDYLQANVTSFESFISGNYVVLQTSCNDNFNVQIGLESTSPADTNYDYGSGLLAFVARGCGIGSTETVNVYFYGESAEGKILRKSSSDGYSTVPGAIIAQTTIDGDRVAHVTYSVIDGGELDDDGLEDGNIVDPIGLANERSSLAATGNSVSNYLAIASLTILTGASLVLIRKTANSISSDQF